MRRRPLAALAVVLTLASRLIAGDPATAEEFHKRGTQRAAEGNLDGAIADFTEALKLDPKLGAALVGRGNARAMQRESAAAMEDFDAAIALDAKNAAAWIGRGNAKANADDPDGAIADWSRAIELDPKNPKPLCNRAWFRFDKKGEIDAALKDFDEAIKLDPAFGLALTNRGLVRRAKADFDGAAGDFAAAVKLDPKDGMARWNAVVLEYWRQDFKRALEHAEAMHAGLTDDFWRDYAAILVTLCRVRLLEKDPGTAATRETFKGRDGKAARQWTASIAAFLRGELAEAEFLVLKDSSETHEAKDQSVQGWFYAGSVRLAAGDRAKAKEYFEKCVALEMKGFDEFELAKVELARLNEKK